MTRSFVVLLAVLCGFFGGPAEAAGALPYGRWVLTVEGRNLMVLDVRPGEGGSAASGTVTRPAAFSISPARAFSRVSEPVVALPILEATSQNGALAFSVASPRQGGDPVRFVLRAACGDRAELTFVGVPTEPFTVLRAGAEAAVAASWEASESYRVDEHFEDDPLLARLFAEDQEARAPGRVAGEIVRREDAGRRAAARRLIEEGRVRTGLDFERAAFIFQHGDRPDDYLLAHSLAMLAVSRGRETALWIASASLDRYLLAIGRPQIFGTQTARGDGAGLPAQPYDEALIPSGLKRSLGVAE